MAKVIAFPGKTKADLDPKYVLEQVLDDLAFSDCKTLLVIAMGKDGKSLNSASSTSNAGELLLMLEQWKLALITGELDG